MSISFNQVPSNLRVPFVAAEFDNSRANKGPAALAYRALLVGQKLNSGSAVADSFYRVTSADQVATLCGRGSILHRMAQAWFSGNKSTEVWIGVLADSSASALSTGTITVSGTATAAGTIALYVGGRRVVVAVASGDTANTIAGNIATAIGKHAVGTVSFVTPGAGDDVTIGGTVFVATTGAVVLGAATYCYDTSATAAAASLAAQVNAHATAKTKVRASSNVGVTTLRAVDQGAVGNAITLATADVVNAAISGATLTGATTDPSDLAVHASVSSAVVTLYGRNLGSVLNELDVRANYTDGDAYPAGVSLAVVAMSGGTSNPTLTALITNMGDVWYQVIAHPYTDATSLTAIENELTDRNGPMRMIDGQAITAKADTYSNVAALGLTRNNRHSHILRTNESPTPPSECAAHVAGVVALSASIDPARPLQTLSLPWIKAPAEVDQDTLTERNLILSSGISTMKVVSGSVQLERLITTYRLNAAGSPDESYLNAETMFTLLYLRYSFRVLWAQKYPRHKLASDGGNAGPGQAIMTPKLAKAEAVAWFSQMEELGLVEGLDQFKADLIVERNVSNPNRLDMKLSPDLINQLIVTAAQIQFLL